MEWQEERRQSSLVIGGDVAAARVALELAQEGQRVHLVTRTPSLGQAPLGNPRPVECSLFPELLAAAFHPQITLLTNARVTTIEGQEGDYSVTLLRHPRYVDEEKCAACGRCEANCPVGIGRDSDGRAIYLPYTKSVPAAYVIEKRGTAPCRAACPIHQRAQGYIALIREGRYEDALRAIREENPFPSICGRVCDHRCEDECSRQSVDEPVSIRALKRFVADWAYAKGKSAPLKAPPAKGPPVAVVGSGPAGLTAARELALLGYRVTIFEALPVPGGMMRVGIPPFRLPPELIEREIDEILALGVELKLNSRVEDIDALLEEYEALFLTLGAHRGRKLPIPGADLPGVLVNTDFLRQVNLGQEVELGKRVLVLGGGDVAIDVARTAVRLGAKRVEMACLESREAMPAYPWEIEAAEAEGIIIHPCRAFKEIVHNKGRITGVQCLDVTFMEFDEDGRLTLETRPGSEHLLPCDAVIFAIGQDPDLGFLSDGELEITSRRTIAVDPETLATGKPGVFAGGDAVTGTTFVVDAIAAGQRAARSIDRYLRGEELRGEPFLPPKAELTEEEIAQRLSLGLASRRPRVQVATLPPSKAKRSFGEVELGFTEEQARAEAERCLSCGLCSECLECEIACETGAIDHEERPLELRLQVGSILLADARELEGLPLPLQTISVPSLPAPFPLTLRLPLGERDWRLDGGPRIGVFVCRCGGYIGEVIDVAEVCREAGRLPGVVHTQEIPYACLVEGTESIHQAIAAHNLNQAILAACSCCSLDQICYSCSYQRVRSKINLLRSPSFFEFVNIREHCALVHADEPERATEKAKDLVASAVARIRLMTVPLPKAQVEAWRCRGCGTCEEVCQVEAIKVREDGERPIAQVDASLCTGCGTCAALCPSGAITAGYISDRQLEVTLEALLASPNPEPKVVVFCCNWKAYSGAEMAGLQGLSYPPNARLVRLQCLGRLHPGLILKAFELGAAGVLMLGCPPEECEHQFGNQGAEELFKRTRALMGLLGIDKRRLHLDSIPLGDGGLFAQKVKRFVQRV